MEISAYIFWNLWKARNAWCFNKERWLAHEIIQKSLDEWTEFKLENITQTSEPQLDKIPRRNVGSRQTNWQEPVEGTIKLNVCSSKLLPNGRVGLGIIARDEKGAMVQAWSIAKSGCFNPVVAEVEAVRIAQIVAQQNEWRSIEVQVDIKAIYDCLQAKCSPVYDAWIIAEDIFLLSLMFENCNFSYCHKRVNRAVSSLARLAVNSNSSCSWKGQFPQWLMEEAACDIESV
ncbi:uncharacterized protein LOC127788238 [Diospyros lotus]|uniref:uncharacterized protein LOC127788238 n=1 Tax=Diospyros lotus TaxID=55363 RepID=UPI002253D13C|nr:uncharacterized protein LOC127788238 [Diospyros lotus]